MNKNNNVIITGASGLVATELTMLLVKREDTRLFLISTSLGKIKKRYEAFSNVCCFTLDEFETFCEREDLSFRSLIHTAFSRSVEGDLLVQSLEYTRCVLSLAKRIRLDSCINISSQGVYGQKSVPLWKEDTLLAPNYMYALGKYSSELLTNVMLEDTGINYTSVRLSSVCENARFLNVFVKNALNNIPIQVLGGSQVCLFIDVRDVASALAAMIDEVGRVQFATSYNLGTNTCYTILELARLVKSIGEDLYGLNVTIQREESSIKQEVGMDSTLFMRTFEWEPRMSISEMIRSLFELSTNVNGGGGYPLAFKFVNSNR